MRTLLGMSLVVALSGGLSAADEKIDAKKLIGKWEPKDTKDPAGRKFVIEFAKDDKVTLTAGEPGKDFKAEGTYKLDGNKLTLTIKFGEKEEKMTRTVSKLTDTELVSKDDKEGKEDTLVRVKEKKDK